MISTRDIVITIILTILLFFLSFFYVQPLIVSNDGYFFASKNYGFPMTVFSVSSKKAQESIKVEDFMAKENSDLFNNGWDIKAGTEKTDLVSASTLNFLSCLVFSSIFVGLFNAIIFTVVRKTKGYDYR